MISIPILASAFALSTPPAQHPFSVHDMLAMQRISEHVVSPDGKWVLFNVRTTDVEANKGRTDLWLAAVDGSSVKRLTKDEASESNGRWMPDGKSVVFLSSKSGSSQIWRLGVDGGEPEQLSKLPLDVDTFAVFPDGTRFVVSLEVYLDLQPEKALAGTAQRDEERAKSKVQAKIYETLMFRHWDGWEDGKRSHLFVWDSSSGAARDLMLGLDGDTPTKPFGGTEEYAISPSGDEVVFGCQLFTRDMAWTTNLDVYTVGTGTASPAPKCVTTANKATDNQPCYSPDGKWIAYLAMSRPGYEADQQKITLMDRVTGKTRVLGASWDRSPGEIAWSNDSQRIYTSADDVGQKSMYVFGLDGSSGRLARGGTNAGPREAGSRLVFQRDTLRSPVEIFTSALNGSDARALTKLNADKVAATKMGDFEQFTFAGWNNELVHAWIVKPIDFDAARKYPVAFLIHGGPQGSFGDHFHYRWNPQAYAGAGYAAIMVDFHGSTGYGQAFTDAINHQWGSRPYEDLMKGLDAALARYKFLDPARTVALGASYGGYMVNWIAGHTDRFRALVCHDGNIDERMAYYDTEELWFPEWEHGGTPWENPAGYTEHNPIDYVKNWKTPTLVIHGAKDFRVVDTQGMSAFTALQRKGVPSKFLWFPDENHWVLKPQNSILWHETVIGWIDRWAKVETDARR